jgi:hypothetical protein
MERLERLVVEVVEDGEHLQRLLEEMVEQEGWTHQLMERMVLEEEVVGLEMVMETHLEETEHFTVVEEVEELDHREVEEQELLE